MRSGFTLIEAAIVMVIVGIGTVGLLQLFAAGTMSNAESTELLVGVNLANDIRELSRSLAFSDPTLPTNWGLEAGETASAVSSWDDLDDLDGRIISPPIDARRQPLTDYSNWTQSIDVETLNPNNLTATVTQGTQPVVKVTVTIFKSGLAVCETSWVVAQGS